MERVAPVFVVEGKPDLFVVELAALDGAVGVPVVDEPRVFVLDDEAEGLTVTVDVADWRRGLGCFWPFAGLGLSVRPQQRPSGVEFSVRVLREVLRRLELSWPPSTFETYDGV